MNRDTYTFEERFLSWLRQSAESSEPCLGQYRSNIEGQSNPGDWLDRVGEVTSAPLCMHQFEEISPRSSGPEPLQLGAKSVVQERYYALLKQRFQQEMEVRPPLFPWESELREYEDAVAIAAWEPQLHQLHLPVNLPEDVLATLFERCQTVAQTAMQDGRRLVEAVESLFPNDLQSLNLLANTVRLGYARNSGAQLADHLLGHQQLASYESAAEQQKMALAMVAAYEVLHRLVLDLSENRPEASQSWQTASGELRIRVERKEGLLQIEATLPEAGEISVYGGSNAASSRRSDAGPVSLLIPETLQEACRLQVQLSSADAPLSFSIRL